MVTDWQQTAWCPDCDYYSCGICGNPIRRDNNAACPFDGKELLLREVAIEAPNDQAGKLLDTGSCETLKVRPQPDALEQAIKERIVARTGGRLQALEIERMDREVIVRGSTSCYYLKQLALQRVLDVLKADRETKVELNFQVIVCSHGPTELTAPVGVSSSSPEPL